MSPEAMKLARDSRIDGRRAYATERTSNGTIVGAGGMAITRKIIGNVDEDSRNKSDKKFFMVAGTSGSGKSTLVESGLIPNMPTEQKAAHLDIDKFKKGLYGYNNGEGAVQVHPAARIAVQKAVDASATRGIDVVLQGYGNDSAQLRRAKSMGYQTIGHFVYTPKSVASKRVEDREEVGGPKIGSELSQILSDELPSRIAQQIQRGLYDDFYLWDNNKNSKDGASIKPEIIASRSADGSYSIENEPLFNKFFGADSKDIKKYWETNKDLNTAINDAPQSIDSYSSNDGKINYKKFNPIQ
jgi:predicted ABC-type ATPase